ncbi:MAG: hypothetical protein KJ709_00620 [Nanoarchaeota archaeon]|nr:hypothetical protein [Nanoarchaeota archaeon]
MVQATEEAPPKKTEKDLEKEFLGKYSEYLELHDPERVHKRNRAGETERNQHIRTLDTLLDETGYKFKGGTPAAEKYIVDLVKRGRWKRHATEEEIKKGYNETEVKDPTEQDINDYFTLIGMQGGKTALLNMLEKSTHPLSWDNLPDDHPLKGLIRHVSQGENNDQRKIQNYNREFVTNHKYMPFIKKHIAKDLDRKDLNEIGVDPSVALQTLQGSLHGPISTYHPDAPKKKEREKEYAGAH